MHPILYSFRRCPYAMRARMALKYSGVKTELREVDLKHKPDAMMACSAKATVPVLQLADGRVLDESLDIIYYALAQSDPDNWRPEGTTVKAITSELIEYNDTQFKNWLDHYKYADRYPEFSAKYYRTQGEVFLKVLEARLQNNQYLLTASISLMDVAIFPFVRQFAFVDRNWFRQSGYVQLNRWLDEMLESDLFITAMQKYTPWQQGDALTVF